MKIYQIHDRFGEWEDYRDRILASYLHKEKAEEELEKLRENERELVRRAMDCAGCPLFDWLTLEEFREYTKDGLLTCPHFEKAVDDGEVTCRNVYTHWDDHDYEIEEVEVIE